MRKIGFLLILGLVSVSTSTLRLMRSSITQVRGLVGLSIPMAVQT